MLAIFIIYCGPVSGQDDVLVTTLMFPLSFSKCLKWSKGLEIGGGFFSRVLIQQGGKCYTLQVFFPIVFLKSLNMGDNKSSSFREILPLCPTRATAAFSVTLYSISSSGGQRYCQKHMRIKSHLGYINQLIMVGVRECLPHSFQRCWTLMSVREHCRLR